MQKLSLATASLTAAITAGALVLPVLVPAAFSEICQEDHLVENSQFLFWVLGSVTFAYAARRARRSRLRRVWMSLLAAFAFWTAGEEVSWGQRVFGFATPAWLARRNVQHEVNLHNLAGVHGRIRAVGLVCLAVLAFLIPFAYERVRAARTLVDRLELPVFPLFAAPTVAIAAAFMAVPRFYGQVIFEFDEIGELLIPVAFAAFALSCAPLPAATIAPASLAPAEEPVRD